jgi:two-component system, cell cycle sensor histidine kinase and response regulator CckA
VTERARSRSNDRHRQAQRLQTVGLMAGGVAHDFANLITIIAGYSEILLKRLAKDDPSRVELNEIRRAVDRGARLTSQLLGFARGQSAEPARIDLSALVLGVCEMLRPIIGERIEIELALAPRLSRIMADPGAIEQVVMNLMLNARDSMPKGGAIRVETRDCEIGAEAGRHHSIDPGLYVALSIGDQGHGIDSEAMQHLFEPFFTTREKGKGTGLGLSTVREIVTGNRGAVWAASPGVGATFTVYLPRIRMTAAPSDPLARPRLRAEAAAPSNPVETCNETILLVEDEDPVRRLLSTILRGRGYAVIDASSGDEALAIFAERGDSIHLLLTDVVMPKMNGRELSGRLRQIRPGLKVVYMSGYADEVLVDTCSSSPGMWFLQKPLRPETLATAVRIALDSPSAPFNPR